MIGRRLDTEDATPFAFPMTRFLRETDHFFSQYMSPVTRNLFYCVAIGFVVFYGLTAMGRGMPLLGVLADRLFVLTPSQAVMQFNIWQFVTYMLGHGNFFHFFFNVIVLFFFGSLLEERMGGSGFLRFVLIAVVVAGIAHAIACFGSGQPGVGIIGFSAAAYAIITACALYYPRMTVYFFFFPVQMRILALLLGLLVLFDLVGSFRRGPTQISHLAHAMGIVVALIYVYLPMLTGGSGGGGGGGGGRRRGRKSSGRLSMGHPGRHSNADDLYNDPHWKLDQ